MDMQKTTERFEALMDAYGDVMLGVIEAGTAKVQKGGQIAREKIDAQAHVEVEKIRAQAGVEMVRLRMEAVSAVLLSIAAHKMAMRQAMVSLPSPARAVYEHALEQLTRREVEAMVGAGLDAAAARLAVEYVDADPDLVIVKHHTRRRRVTPNVSSDHD
jgi:hypothetical protein